MCMGSSPVPVFLGHPTHMLGHIPERECEPFVLVVDVVLLHQLLHVERDQPQLVPRHTGERMKLVMEVEAAVEPVHPPRALVVRVHFDLSLGKAYVFLVVDLDPRFPIVVAEQLQGKHSLHYGGYKIGRPGVVKLAEENVDPDEVENAAEELKRLGLLEIDVSINHDACA